jgi:hypothetical protein
MLQLTQVLKFETFLDSSLTRFLLRRALRSTRKVGHVLFWYLKAEMHIPGVALRFGAILQQYLQNCGDHRVELGHQMFVMSKLEDIALKVLFSSGDLCVQMLTFILDFIAGKRVWYEGRTCCYPEVGASALSVS